MVAQASAQCHLNSLTGVFLVFGEFETVAPDSAGKGTPVSAFRMLALNDRIQHAKNFLLLPVGIGCSLEPWPCSVDDGDCER